jgi:hypothetical protein
VLEGRCAHKAPTKELHIGAFTQKPSAYTPPLDGTKPGATLVGTDSDASAVGSGVNDNDAVPTRAGTLPDRDDSGEWRIELRRLPLLHRGHAVLALVGPNNQWIELNGLSKSRHTGDVVAVGVDGGKLIASTKDRTFGPDGTEMVGEVARGSYDDIVNGRWARGLRAADAITDKNYDYKGHDPAYEFGASGGQIQNSNSVAFTLGKAMGLGLDDALRRAGMQWTFSGWGRDLLDRSYQPYVAPPQFAVHDTP